MHPSEDGSTDLSVLQRVQAHDPEAWCRLVDLYGPLVHGWCRRGGLRPGDVADVFQDVFLAVAAHVADFRRDRAGDTFRGWLWAVTRSKIRDHFRRCKDRPAAEGGTDGHARLARAAALEPAGDDEPSDPEATRALLHRALDLIRDDYDDKTWQAFWRVTVEGQTSAEVGAALGLSANAVRKAKARILRRLRKDLKDLIP